MSSVPVTQSKPNVLTRSSFAVVDTNIILENVRYLQTYASNVAPAVKANAYGIGAVPVVQKLYDNGIREFFVAFFEEGVELRQKIPGDYIIYILHDVKGKKLKDYQHFKLIPVLYDGESIEYWKQHGKGWPCVIHFDTGMRRVGAPLNANIDKLNVALVMSHLSASEVQDHPMNPHQLHLFSNIQIKARKSLANSGGIFLGAEYHFDVARPGIACYGFDSFGHPAIQNCIKIFAQVLQIDHVHEGFVGYNLTHEITKPTIIATLGIGYGDGVPRDISYVRFGEYKASVIGRVSMDLLTVDVTHVPEASWSETVWVSDDWPGFAYQYALKLSPRVKKLYL